MRPPTSARRRASTLPAALVALLLALPWPTAAAASLRLTPSSIDIGAFFSGARVQVSAEIPRGSEVVVEVVGRRIEEQLLRKGQHWDIWMNVGEIDIEDAPCLYFALSTDRARLARTGGEARFGYAALRRRASFVGDVEGMTRSEIFREFVELKESERLYRQQPGELAVSRAAGGNSTVEGTFRIPSRVAPGEYKVRLTILDHGRVLRSETAKLRVRLAGLPAFLFSLARRHGALYGLFAVAIAVIFGFVVGVVFKKRR